MTRTNYQHAPARPRSHAAALVVPVLFLIPAIALLCAAVAVAINSGG